MRYEENAMEWEMRLLGLEPKTYGLKVPRSVLNMFGITFE